MKLTEKKKAVAQKMKPNKYVKTKNIGGYPKYVKVNTYK